jgi:hypothetical protein
MDFDDDGVPMMALILPRDFDTPLRAAICEFWSALLLVRLSERS